MGVARARATYEQLLSHIAFFTQPLMPLFFLLQNTKRRPLQQHLEDKRTIPSVSLDHKPSRHRSSKPNNLSNSLQHSRHSSSTLNSSKTFKRRCSNSIFSDRTIPSYRRRVKTRVWHLLMLNWTVKAAMLPMLRISKIARGMETFSTALPSKKRKMAKAKKKEEARVKEEDDGTIPGIGMPTSLLRLPSSPAAAMQNTSRETPLPRCPLRSPGQNWSITPGMS